VPIGSLSDPPIHPGRWSVGEGTLDLDSIEWVENGGTQTLTVGQAKLPLRGRAVLEPN
jgi:hypothetical protein